VQTSTPGTFPTAFGSALKEMTSNAKEFRFPFGLGGEDDEMVDDGRW